MAPQERARPDIRVILVDDHPVVRRGLAALLDTLAGMEVVAEAGDGDGALREVALNRPDVVVMDLRMPGTDGVEATRRIAREHPSAAVLVLTMFDDDSLIGEALRAGARGYLLKRADQDEIERAIRAVAAGQAIFSREVAGRLVGAVTADPDPFPGLTPREREVLDLMAGGASNAAVAERLGVVGKTVGNHVSSIFLKLGVATRVEAVVMARDAGLGRHG
ncbi:response regulator transcription factor [Nocardioides euryhalodurans]|uniref:Response regulator transcription factor n=1 Tax=Nocardioides euryhalodurans TaxID=2518370 RepID=A0A4P7GKH0_9ACTN|nr:response regulator transcription factor [Nocardioides euryhalodurans]QBR92267.1 response regulator transcription factor [Nocardioides euryhalodurans]